MVYVPSGDLITGNQFVKNSLWAIGLMPGVASHTANTDGGSIIANNIISDFGHGDAHWIWGSDNVPLRFDHGQEPDDPPLTDVIVQGNMLHNSGPPRYRYAVVVEGEPNAPRACTLRETSSPREVAVYRTSNWSHDSREERLYSGPRQRRTRDRVTPTQRTRLKKLGTQTVKPIIEKQPPHVTTELVGCEVFRGQISRARFRVRLASASGSGDHPGRTRGNAADGGR